MSILRKTLVLILLLLTPQTRAAAQQHGWYTDYRTAQQLAQSKNATLLVHVFGPQCTPCQRMERTVFTDPEVQQALTEGIVAVKIDGSANFALVTQLGVRNYPSEIITRPGNPPFIKAGAVNRDQYLAFLRQIAARPTPAQSTSKKSVNPTPAKPSRTDLVAPEPRKPESAPRPMPQVADKQDAGDAPNQPLDFPLTGLDGFCPVTLQQQRKIKPGNPRYSAIYQGIRYQFASADFRDQFRAAPERYARSTGLRPHRSRTRSKSSPRHNSLRCLVLRKAVSLPVRRKFANLQSSTAHLVPRSVCPEGEADDSSINSMIGVESSSPCT